MPLQGGGEAQCYAEHPSLHTRHPRCCLAQAAQVVHCRVVVGRGARWWHLTSLLASPAAVQKPRGVLALYHACNGVSGNGRHGWAWLHASAPPSHTASS